MALEDIKGKVEAMIDQLRPEREKLGAKLSLAKLETREEWQRLERKMAKLLGEEIRDGLRDIDRHL